MNLVKICLPPILALMALCSGPAAHAEGNQRAYGLIVKMKSTSSARNKEAPQRTRERLTRAFQGKSLPMGMAEPSGPDAHWVRWQRPLEATEAQALIRELKADPNVEWAVPNVREKRLQSATPDDPLYPNQWWLNASPVAGSRGVPNIQQSWDTEPGATVNVAVLDTGLLVNHPDLQSTRFDIGYDLVTNEDGLAGDGNGRDADFSDPGDGVAAGDCGTGEPAEDSSWHGTRIAGQIGAVTDNNLGVAGINRAGRVISVRVATQCGALVSDIIDGMRWAAGIQVGSLPLNMFPAKVINLSFGSDNVDCTPYQSTIDELLSRGILLVAAAGNGDGAITRPARCRGALAVGALNRDGFKASYSNFGTSIGIMTVGGDPGGAAALLDTGILSTDNDGVIAPAAHSYRSASGTSFSTPIVAGVASLMLSLNPALTLDQLVYGMQLTARPHVSTHPTQTLPVCQVGVPQGRCYCTTATCGPGILDAAAALAYASPPGPFGTAPVFGAAPAAPASSGGGALGVGWLLALAVAVTAVSRTTRHARRAD
jgi:serine protease